MRLHHSNIQIDRVRFWNVALILSCRGHAELVIRIPLQIFDDPSNSSHSARLCFTFSHSLLYLYEKKVCSIYLKPFVQQRVTVDTRANYFVLQATLDRQLNDCGFRHYRLTIFKIFYVTSVYVYELPWYMDSTTFDRTLEKSDRSEKCRIDCLFVYKREPCTLGHVRHDRRIEVN